MIDRILSFNIDEYLAWYENASLLMNYNEFAELKAEQFKRKAVIYRGLLERFNTNPKENVKSGECAKKIMDMISLEKQEFSPLQYFPAANYWFPTGDQWGMIKKCRTAFIQVDIEKIRHSISVLSDGTHLVKDKLNELNDSGLNFGDSILNKYPIYSTGNEPNELRDFITDINRIDLIKWLYDQFPIDSAKPQKETKKALTHPQKIILLEKLGFFGLAELKNKGQRQKETIISILLGEDETNTRKYINGLQKKAVAGSFNPYKNKENEKVVNELLNILG